MKNVLIIEDDLAMLRGLEDNFKAKGYFVKTACDGEQGLNAALTESPDLVILDIVLPKINGYEVCSLIRKNELDVPVIMLTAKDEESDVILGLDVGADDYVTKPFSIKVLLARADAFLRRRGDKLPPVYEFGCVRLDTINRTLTRDGREIPLAPWEFKTLCLFLSEQGRVFSREEILSHVWGYCHFISLHDIDRDIAGLRTKIEPNPDKPTFLLTVGHSGYRFEMPKLNGNSADN
jgi:DNA-binding response OmpR family regulator